MSVQHQNQVSNAPPPAPRPSANNVPDVNDESVDDEESIWNGSVDLDMNWNQTGYGNDLGHDHFLNR